MKIVIENNCGPILFLGRWLSVNLRKIERNYHSGEHVLTGHFRWHALYAVRSRNILDTSQFSARKLNAKDFRVPKTRENFFQENVTI